MDWLCIIRIPQANDRETTALSRQTGWTVSVPVVLLNNILHKHIKISMFSRLLVIVLVYSIVQTTLAMNFLRVTSSADEILVDISDKEPRRRTVNRVVLKQEDVFKALHKQEHGPELIERLNLITEKNANSPAYSFIVADKHFNYASTWAGMGHMGSYESITPELASVLHNTIKKVLAQKEKERKIQLAKEKEELRRLEIAKKEPEKQEKRLAFLRITTKEDTIVLDSSDKEPRPSTVNQVILTQEEVFSVLQKETHGPEAIQLLNHVNKKNANQMSPAYIVADKEFKSPETWSGMGRLATYEPVTPELAQVLRDAVKKVLVQKETEKKAKLAQEEDKLRELELAQKEEEELAKRSAAGSHENPTDAPAGLFSTWWAKLFGPKTSKPSQSTEQGQKKPGFFAALWAKLFGRKTNKPSSSASAIEPENQSPLAHS
ncbi:uncharacterized protein PGTG_21876 [Puccinia graminis f. sp. tritici CRL 75-36-700-3]|uniref:Uncharacterized protein n=1 Tax=Puccinia graminis f. sp. tritici (strain CRL 75-36-700-3 / race SCCL) TaxID=418459 RepID=H6QSU4_PUCGT|nr:uncharacterized protein PGTG_21876 [Puccinia graminis f. sp. tritici CRL 75-36-700-3]EHS63837.1 hypothetical protein PGTG_21876 [Puccinia graminis f. sp. tritici CRL 75-36-700-3]